VGEIRGTQRSPAREEALIWDALRMTVIDLASFCKRMRTKEGFSFRPPLGPSPARTEWDALFPGGVLLEETSTSFGRAIASYWRAR
jgi:hypothetical protein